MYCTDGLDGCFNRNETAWIGGMGMFVGKQQCASPSPGYALPVCLLHTTGMHFLMTTLEKQC